MKSVSTDQPPHRCSLISATLFNVQKNLLANGRYPPRDATVHCYIVSDNSPTRNCVSEYTITVGCLSGRILCKLIEWLLLCLPEQWQQWFARSLRYRCVAHVMLPAWKSGAERPISWSDLAMSPGIWKGDAHWLWWDVSSKVIGWVRITWLVYEGWHVGRQVYV